MSKSLKIIFQQKKGPKTCHHPCDHCAWVKTKTLWAKDYPWVGLSKNVPQGGGHQTPLFHYFSLSK